jgi:hypothetical protein
MTTRWLIDGWDLTQGLVRDVEDRAGWFGIAPPRGDNPTVPNRDGVLWRAKHRGPGSVALNVILDGLGDPAALEAAYDDLVRAASPLHRLVALDRVPEAGHTRRAMAELTSTIAPTMLGKLGMRCQLAFSIPTGRWDGLVQVSSLSAAGAAAALPFDLIEFDGGTAPLPSLAYRVDGPAQNPTVVDEVGGGWWTYTGTLTAGQSLTVDAGAWTVTGSGGLVANPAALTYSGPGYLTLAAPPPGGHYRVRLDGGGQGAGSRLTVSGVLGWLA